MSASKRHAHKKAPRQPNDSARTHVQRRSGADRDLLRRFARTGASQGLRRTPESVPRLHEVSENVREDYRTDGIFSENASASDWSLVIHAVIKSDELIRRFVLWLHLFAANNGLIIRTNASGFAPRERQENSL
jgi:hypothetical protein